MKVLILTNRYPTSECNFYGIFVKEQIESLSKEGISGHVFFINGRDNRLSYFLTVACLMKELRYGHCELVHAHHMCRIDVSSKSETQIQLLPARGCVSACL